MRRSKLVLGFGVNDWHESVSIKGKNIPEHQLWVRMLRRCYSDKTKLKQPSYASVSCCERWLSMSNFISDVSSYVGYENALYKGWNLDKDILIKGNRVYSPSTCCFVPPHVNNLFTKANSIRGEYPIGVQRVLYKVRGKLYPKFRCQLNIEGKVRTVGHFSNAADTFDCYKIHKEAEIKRVANIYRHEIDNRVYSAMMEYIVEPTD